MLYLRWALLLPGSIAAGVAFGFSQALWLHFVMSDSLYSEFVRELATMGGGAAAMVWSATRIAPSKKRIVAIVFATALGTLAALGIGYMFLTGASWLAYVGTFAVLIAAIGTAYYDREPYVIEEAKKWDES